MKSTIKKYITGGAPSLLVTNHGTGAAYSSAIAKVELEGETGIFASGVGRAISCDRSIYADQRVSCIYREEGTRKPHMYNEFQYNRLYSDCAGQRGCRETPLIEFSQKDCPVESIKLLSNTKFNRIRAAPYFHQAACVRNGVLQPSRILRRYMDHPNNKYDVVEMASATADGLVPTLINSTFVGADRYPHLFLGAYSIRDGAYFIYEVVPLKVLE
jgi:hypothetical protein